MKKVLALFLAMLMCMALAVSAMAGVTIKSGGDISKGDSVLLFDTKLQEPVIKVTVPAAAQTLVLNPYNIKVQNDGNSVASGDRLFGTSVGSGNDGSVLAAKLFLKNQSNVPLKVSLKATGEIPNGSKATFDTKAVTSTETNKKVFLFVDVGQKADIKSGDVPGSPELSTKKASDFASANKYQAIVKKGDTLLTNVLEIPTPASMGASINYATIQIGGNCTTTPTEKWLPTDTVTLKLVFSFQATNNTPSA